MAIETAQVVVNGLGGGGSVVAPEFVHLGFQDLRLFDPGRADESNLNRTMTLVESDIAAGTFKVDAARRRILEINPLAKVETHACRWQDYPNPDYSREIKTKVTTYLTHTPLMYRMRVWKITPLSLRR